VTPIHQQVNWLVGWWGLVRPDWWGMVPTGEAWLVRNGPNTFPNINTYPLIWSHWWGLTGEEWSQHLSKYQHLSTNLSTGGSVTLHVDGRYRFTYRELRLIVDRRLNIDTILLLIPSLTPVYIECDCYKTCFQVCVFLFGIHITTALTFVNVLLIPKERLSLWEDFGGMFISSVGTPIFFEQCVRAVVYLW